MQRGRASGQTGTAARGAGTLGPAPLQRVAPPPPPGHRAPARRACPARLAYPQATGRSHTWTNIEGHACGAYKDEAESKASEAQR